MEESSISWGGKKSFLKHYHYSKCKAGTKEKHRLTGLQKQKQKIWHDFIYIYTYIYAYI